MAQPGAQEFAALKLRVDIDGESLLLDLHADGAQTAYAITGEPEQRGRASIIEVMPGVFSLLLGERSYRVHIAPRAGGVEVWVGVQRYLISLADPRDRAANGRPAGAAGPMELRAQMPGKIIKLLVAEGAEVEAGDGLIVVEAMKMQNEVKAPKAGRLTRMHVSEGSTVSAGDPLLLVE